MNDHPGMLHYPFRKEAVVEFAAQALLGISIWGSSSESSSASLCFLALWFGIIG